MSPGDPPVGVECERIVDRVVEIEQDVIVEKVPPLPPWDPHPRS